MGDIPANVATFKSAVNTVSKKKYEDEKEHKMRRLRMALALMGFGAWDNLEPGINVTFYVNAYGFIHNQHLILRNTLCKFFQTITSGFVTIYYAI